MTHNIDEGAARCRQQPGLWILRHAVFRPSFECSYQRIAESVLRASHVSRLRGKIGHKTTLRLAGTPLDRAMSALLAAFVHHVIRCLAPGARGRTSTAPVEDAGQRAAQ